MLINSILDLNFNINCSLLINSRFKFITYTMSNKRKKNTSRLLVAKDSDRRGKPKLMDGFTIVKVGNLTIKKTKLTEIFNKNRSKPD